MNRLPILLCSLLLWCSAAFAQTDPAAFDLALPRKVLVSYAMYQGDCDLADDESHFIAWQSGSEEASSTDEEVSQYVQFLYDGFLERRWKDDFQPSHERVCTPADHTYRVHFSIRVHRGASEGGECATWTDKKHICTNCGHQYTEQMVDEQTHPYWDPACHAWVPALRVPPFERENHPSDGYQE